jgi:hypothetical protein
MPLPREMSEDEKNDFRIYFPLLNLTGEIVTDEASPMYNCIAWTVNYTDRWIWPGNDKLSFDDFYAQYSCYPSEYGPISIFGHINNGFISEVTHGSKISHDGLFESKCGANLRILHILDNLQNELYGRIVGYYSHVKHNIKPAILKLTTFEKQKIQEKTSKIPLKEREKFKTIFKKWKSMWFIGKEVFLFDPYTRAQGEEFEQLLEMGADSIPLVIEALAEPDNFFAISLYERLQQDTRLHVKIRPDSYEILQGEQSRAVRIIRKWLEQ